MSRIAARFQRLKQAGRTALVPYITAGDPEPAATVDFMHALVEAGADLLELGVPFSDPMADGPAIQAAHERALRHHVSLSRVLAMVAEFRERDTETPVILMGYENPIEAMGYATFAERAAGAGVDGVLTVDLPPEEATEPLAIFRAHGLDPIFLISPTTGEARLDAICSHAGGFVYYVSLKGVTGAANLDVDAIGERLALIRRHTGLPVGVGFGIKNAETARAVGRVADAVVVGSALVNRIADNAAEPAEAQRQITELVAAMRAGLDEPAAEAAG